MSSIAVTHYPVISLSHKNAPLIGMPETSISQERNSIAAI